MLHGLAHSTRELKIFRFLLGAAEPANFPAGIKAVTEWFPIHERALAAGIFVSGTSVGSSLAVPVVSWIAIHLGWRVAFVITGSLGFLWVLVWVRFYQRPEDHKLISQKERTLILSSIEPSFDSCAKVGVSTLLRMRETWGCIIARALTDPISYFLAFWTPKYFQEERGFTLGQVGHYLWIPFLAYTLGYIASGAIPRLLITRGWSVDRARKTTMLVVSCAMPFFCLSITRVSTAGLAIIIIAALMFGHACWGNVTLPAEVFPKAVVGTVSGFGGAMGAALGAVSQWQIGKVVQNTSFAPVFAACSVAYLTALALVQWLVGELGVIRKVEP